MTTHAIARPGYVPWTDLQVWPPGTPLTGGYALAAELTVEVGDMDPQIYPRLRFWARASIPDHEYDRDRDLPLYCPAATLDDALGGLRAKIVSRVVDARIALERAERVDARRSSIVRAL